MGLDQYAYAAAKCGARDEFYEAEYGGDESKRGTVAKPRELAYWRKHPNLQGWMENLWMEKGMPGTGNKDTPFNGIELELTWEDVDRLERDIKSGIVAGLDARGFFFGNPSDDHYRGYDLQFCLDAKAELFLGIKVFYNSSW